MKDDLEKAQQEDDKQWIERKTWQANVNQQWTNWRTKLTCQRPGSEFHELALFGCPSHYYPICHQVARTCRRAGASRACCTRPSATRAWPQRSSSSGRRTLAW